jgi:DNA-binding MarR family transcriptional regulator
MISSIKLSRVKGADRGYMEPRGEREQRALIAARALVDRMRAMYRELEQLTGAPIAAHRALTCINAAPGISASHLATALGMRRSAMSHVLNDLDERGWIERKRDEVDQRSVRIHVTAEGRKLLHATSGKAVGNLQRAVSRLQDAELESVAAGIERMLEHLPDLQGGRARKARQAKGDR